MIVTILVRGRHEPIDASPTVAPGLVVHRNLGGFVPWNYVLTHAASARPICVHFVSRQEAFAVAREFSRLEIDWTQSEPFLGAPLMARSYALAVLREVHRGRFQ
jgi:hypothetical protein